MAFLSSYLTARGERITLLLFCSAVSMHGTKGFRKQDYQSFSLKVTAKYLIELLEYDSIGQKHQFILIFHALLILFRFYGCIFVLPYLMFS